MPSDCSHPTRSCKLFDQQAGLPGTVKPGECIPLSKFGNKSYRAGSISPPTCDPCQAFVKAYDNLSFRAGNVQPPSQNQFVPLYRTQNPSNWSWTGMTLSGPLIPGYLRTSKCCS